MLLYFLAGIVFDFAVYFWNNSLCKIFPPHKYIRVIWEKMLKIHINLYLHMKKKSENVIYRITKNLPKMEQKGVRILSILPISLWCCLMPRFAFYGVILFAPIVLLLRPKAHGGVLAMRSSIRHFLRIRQ